MPNPIYSNGRWPMRMSSYVFDTDLGELDYYKVLIDVDEYLEEDCASLDWYSLYPSYFPKMVVPCWLDRASWRFVFLKSPLWSKLPLEVYEKIDGLFVKTITTCLACGKEVGEKFLCICNLKENET